MSRADGAAIAALIQKQQVIAPGAARRYATHQWQFDSRRIYFRPHISGDRPAAGSQRADCR